MVLACANARCEYINVYALHGNTMSEVVHTEDCGTHAAGEPCCQGYIKWMYVYHYKDYLVWLEAQLGDQE
jgi:hypothetical protein